MNTGDCMAIFLKWEEGGLKKYRLLSKHLLRNIWQGELMLLFLFLKLPNYSLM